MNSIINIPSKGDRIKEKNRAGAKPDKDVKKAQRGANMMSRPGLASKSAHTCYFRGALDETGGKGHAETAQSHVKQLKKRESKIVKEVVTDPVTERDIKSYITVETFKKDQERKRLESEMKKANQNQSQFQNQRSVTVDGAKKKKKKDHDSGEEEDDYDQAPKGGISLYERIATDLRSRQVREDIQYSMKQARTQKNMENNQAMLENKGLNNKVKQKAEDQDEKKRHRKSNSLPFSARKNQPGGHSIWGKEPDQASPPTQWESAVTRNFAQYHRLERVAREFDNVHHVTHVMVDAKARSPHLDDQDYEVVRKKVPHVPTCLKEMPMCTYNNRMLAKQAAEEARLTPDIFETAGKLVHNIVGQAAKANPMQKSILTKAAAKTVETNTLRLLRLESTVGRSQKMMKQKSQVSSSPKRRQRGNDMTKSIQLKDSSDFFKMKDGTDRDSSGVQNGRLSQIDEGISDMASAALIPPMILLPRRATEHPESKLKSDNFANKTKQQRSMVVKNVKGLLVGASTNNTQSSLQNTPRGSSPKKSLALGSIEENLSRRKGQKMQESPMTTKSSFNKTHAFGKKVDVPEKIPGDPTLGYIAMIESNKKVSNFARQRSKQTLLNDAIGHLNDSRFEVINDISDWNGKFESKISQPFQKDVRNTDIPGTIKNTNVQKNGPDNDIFIDVKPDVGKRSLTLGMVDMKKQFNHRESLSKTNQVVGRPTNTWKGEGNMSDPWDYDPQTVKSGQTHLSTYKNNLSLVRPFAKQIPRTKYGSIYNKGDEDEFGDPLLPTRDESDAMRIRNCVTKMSDRNSEPVRALQSFKQAKRQMQNSNGNASISSISYLDFLPNSIAKSPQRNANCHSRTTQRLGLSNTNRIGAIKLLEESRGGSIDLQLSQMPYTPQSQLERHTSAISTGNQVKIEGKSGTQSIAMMSQELTAATKNALQQLCTYSHIEESTIPVNSPSKQAGSYRTPKVLLAQLFAENQGGGFKSSLQKRSSAVHNTDGSKRTSTSSYAATRATKGHFMPKEGGTMGNATRGLGSQLLIQLPQSGARNNSNEFWTRQHTPGNANYK